MLVALRIFNDMPNFNILCTMVLKKLWDQLLLLLFEQFTEWYTFDKAVMGFIGFVEFLEFSSIFNTFIPYEKLNLNAFINPFHTYNFISRLRKTAYSINQNQNPVG